MRIRAARHLLVVLVFVAACGPAPEPTASGSAAPAATRPTTATPRPSPSATPAPTATPSATPTPMPLPRAGVYLALGDSLAVGVGATRSDERGYVARLYAHLVAAAWPGAPRPAELRNLARGGETSASFIAGGQLADAVAAVDAAAPPVTLITLDIGGNDLLRLLRTEPCPSAPDSPACRQLVLDTLAAFEANYRALLGELRAALDRQASPAPLLVMTYFNPFSGTAAAYEAAGDLALVGIDGTLDCAAAVADPQARGMNDVIACAGAELGAEPVDVYGVFRGLGLELTHIGSEDIHANDAGYAVIADAMVEAIANLSSAAD